MRTEKRNSDKEKRIYKITAKKERERENIERVIEGSDKEEIKRESHYAKNAVYIFFVG